MDKLKFIIPFNIYTVFKLVLPRGEMQPFSTILEICFDNIRFSKVVTFYIFLRIPWQRSGVECRRFILESEEMRDYCQGHLRGIQ